MESSELFLNFNMNNMLETKIINGKILIIKLGTNNTCEIKRLRILTLIFLKNSISSNKFKIIQNIKNKTIITKMFLKNF